MNRLSFEVFPDYVCFVSYDKKDFDRRIYYNASVASRKRLAAIATLLSADKRLGEIRVYYDGWKYLFYQSS